MNKQVTFLMVTLIALSIHGEPVAAGEPIEVDRATRADWKGSKLARDATEQEIAEYYAELGGDEDADLADSISAQRETQKRLAAEIGEQIEFVKKSNVTIAEIKDELEALTAKRDKLAEEVARLEKAKAAAAEPVPKAKPAK